MQALGDVVVGAPVAPWIPQAAFPVVAIAFLIVGLGFTVFFLKYAADRAGGRERGRGRGRREGRRTGRNERAQSRAELWVCVVVCACAHADSSARVAAIVLVPSRPSLSPFRSVLAPSRRLSRSLSSFRLRGRLLRSVLFVLFLALPLCPLARPSFRHSVFLVRLVLARTLPFPLRLTPTRAYFACAATR